MIAWSKGKTGSTPAVLYNGKYGLKANHAQQKTRTLNREHKKTGQPGRSKATADDKWEGGNSQRNGG